MYLFQKVEDDIRRNLFEQHLQRINIKVLFSKGGASSPFNKNKWVICEWPICKRERQQSLLVWLTNEMDSQLGKNLVSFIFGIFIPLVLSELKDIVNQTKRSEKGMNSSEMSLPRASSPGLKFPFICMRKTRELPTTISQCQRMERPKN